MAILERTQPDDILEIRKALRSDSSPIAVAVRAMRAAQFVQSGIPLWWQRRACSGEDMLDVVGNVQCGQDEAPRRAARDSATEHFHIV